MHRHSPQAFVGALFLSLTTVIGGVYADFGTEIGTIGGGREGVVWLLLAGVLAIPFYLLLSWVLERQYRSGRSQPASGVLGLFDQHAVIASFVVLLLAFAPYLWVHYPASVTKDSYHQLNMALGLKPYQSRHPLLTTLIYKCLFLLGSHVDKNFGIFCCVLAPTVLAAYAFARCIGKVGSYVRDPRASLIALLFFGGLPVWGFYMQSMTKDTLFFPVFLLFAMTYVDVVDTLTTREDDRVVPSIVWVRLLFWGLLATLLRHGVVLILGFSLLLLALVAFRQRRLVCVTLVVILALHVGCTKAMELVLKPISFPTRAMFSVPFQQTARCMLEVPELVTDEEYEAIDAVLKASKIADRYNPLLADPVKDTFRTETVTSSDISRYLLTWFRMMLKYPRIYFDAFFQHAYGYLDPFHLVKATSQLKVYMSQGDFWLVPLDLHYAHPKTIRSWFDQWGTVWLRTPVCMHIMTPGFYAWVTFVCLLLLWSRRRCRQLIVLSLPALQVLMCIVSPVAGNIRYALPTMAVAPLIIAWTLREVRSSDEGSGRSSEAVAGAARHGEGLHLRR